MKKTNTLIVLAAMAASLTAVSIPAMASAAPLHAQTRVVVIAHNDRGPRFDNHRDDRAVITLNSRISRLDSQIDYGRRTGKLSAREGRKLNAELRSVTTLKRSYERSGRSLNRAEIIRLDNRLDRLQAKIRFEGHDRNWR
ncbi:MAG: hypothetical protein WBQ60_06335 [Asticcacaulis sp.]